MLALAVAQSLGPGSPAFLEQGAFRLQRLERRLRLRHCRLALCDIGFEFADRGVRHLNRLQFALQALAPLLERLPAALQVRLVRLLELNAAFGLHQQAARLGQALLRRAVGLLGLRQPRVLGRERRLGRHEALLGRTGARRPGVQ